MTGRVDIHLHHGGTWVKDPVWRYVGGDVYICKNFDADYLSIICIKNTYKEELKYVNVNQVYYLEPGREIEEGLFVLEDDHGIRRLLSKIDSTTSHLEFFAKHDIDEPIIDSPPSVPPEPIINSPEQEGEDSDDTFMDSHDSDDSEEGDDDSEEGDDNDEGQVPCERRHPVRFNVNDQTPYFSLGMTFASAAEVRESISKYGLSRGVALKYVKSEPYRIRVHCNEPGCPFVLYVSKDGCNPGLAVKTLNEDHNCYRIFSNPRISAKFLAKLYRKKILEQPDYKIKDLKKDVETEWRMNVGFSKCKRARRMVMDEFSGRFTSEYSELEAYAAELLRSNPGSKVQVELSTDELREGRRVFKRMFVCLDACKRGWKEGCRPIIGLDGCFLKTQYKGELLVALGRDGDEQNFPIAWACVKSETKVNWTWFLTLLQEQLDLGDGSQYTFISDMQKGLIQAVIDVLPEAEHRWCARHIYANWSKTYRGGELKKKFWNAAWSTFEEEFKDNMKVIGDMSSKGAMDLMAYPPHTWCRAYFSSRSKSWTVDNNMVESFNSWILEARHKPIRTMMECIRQKTMDRLGTLGSECEKWINCFSPYCNEIFQTNKSLTVGCTVLFNGDTGYEIREGDDTHTVFLDNNSCTCRAWDLTGIPCQHAICALVRNKQDPMNHISKWFHKDVYQAAYKYKIMPVRGKRFYELDKYQPVEPPKVEKNRGRPKIKRRREETEARPTTKVTKLTKKGKSVICSLCKQQGHNKARHIGSSVPAQSQTGSSVPAHSQTGSSVPAQSQTGPSASSAPPTSMPRPSKLQVRPAARAHSRKQSSHGEGFGLLYDDMNGSVTYKSGTSSTILTEGSQPQSPIRDSNTRFSIPNEAQLRAHKATNKASSSFGSRRINHRGDGGPVNKSNIPFKPPGLQWNGRSCITTRQLMADRDERIGRSSNASK